ncbi:MAG: NAD(P)/FAD-dependent oxidoreductase [Clostridiales bacterium]|nr:NAD(P)/FAD-dependent oxidoreductase [Clostridiales bacterium]
MTSDDAKRLAHDIKAKTIDIKGTDGFERAQVTAGGAELHGFDPQNMQSRKVSNLYACGEILNVDGKCGGFNLQWAWSSGRLAGSSAAINVSKNKSGK